MNGLMVLYLGVLPVGSASPDGDTFLSNLAQAATGRFIINTLGLASDKVCIPAPSEATVRPVNCTCYPVASVSVRLMDERFPSCCNWT